MSVTAATPEHEPLQIFIGKWMTAGQGGLITEALTLDGRRAMWQGVNVRATSLFSDDGTIQKCLHERSDDGETWLPAMDITLTKVR